MHNVIKNFFEGSSIDAYKLFGAHKYKENNRDEYRVTCFAPHAKTVELVGTFNDWYGENHKLEKIDERGIWQIITTDLKEYDLYKFRIQTADDKWIAKADPYAFYCELRPKTSSIVYDINDYKWNDKIWMQKRRKGFKKPMSIFECHLSSWKRHEDGTILSTDEMIEKLIPYVKSCGFTHVEILPLNEHPFDGSWGYQATGYFACTSRYGKPKDIKKLIDAFHQNNIGVILDVVPAHFVKDAHGLAEFDGKPVYEYPLKRDSENPWGTCNFNLADDSVRSFLISSFAFWLKEFHIDGLRFDAIAHVLHWGGNKNRGENKGAIIFFKRCNHLLSKHFKHVMLIAEDSSDYPRVTAPTFDNGLGFDYKWDLGWMNDTLRYFKMHPEDRKYHHNLITFSMLYFFNEKFIMPFSHDEVVHMKGSIVNKMWGTYEQKFDQARLLMAYMFAHPGKKLNFMGNEIATFDEWNEGESVAYSVLKYPIHDAFAKFFRDLNHLYLHNTLMAKTDYDVYSFTWIDANNENQSIYSFYRKYENKYMVFIFNMKPVEYQEYRIGVPKKGYYHEVLNSQRDIYNGSNLCNKSVIKSDSIESHGYNDSISIKIAPFSAIYLEYKYRVKKSGGGKNVQK